MKSLIVTALLALSFASHASVLCSIGVNNYSNIGVQKITLEQYTVNKYVSSEGSEVSIGLIGDDIANIKLKTKNGTHAMAFGKMTDAIVTLELDNEKVFCKLVE